jgi:hypothetical protein
MNFRRLESICAVFRALFWQALYVLGIGAKTRLHLQVAPLWRMLGGRTMASKIVMNRARR